VRSTPLKLAATKSDLRFEFLSKSNLPSLWWGVQVLRRSTQVVCISSRSLFVNDLVVFGFPALKFQDVACCLQSSCIVCLLACLLQRRVFGCMRSNYARVASRCGWGFRWRLDMMVQWWLLYYSSCPFHQLSSASKLGLWQFRRMSGERKRRVLLLSDWSVNGECCLIHLPHFPIPCLIGLDKYVWWNMEGGCGKVILLSDWCDGHMLVVGSCRCRCILFY